MLSVCVFHISENQKVKLVFSAYIVMLVGTHIGAAQICCLRLCLSENWDQRRSQLCDTRKTAIL